MLRILLAMYCVGVAVVLLALTRGWFAVQELRHRAVPVTDPALQHVGDECAAALGVRRMVSLATSTDMRVPVVVGVLRPQVILPDGFRTWPLAEQRAALLHELSHVGARDVAFRVASQLACAALWFHPCAWWIARRFRSESERACDDRVLLGGTRPSDYGALLLRVADSGGDAPAARVAPALSGDDGVRGRLAAVVERGRERRAPGRVPVMLTFGATAALSLMLGLIDLAPTRGVLRGLMHDAHWESRAVAVLGLAPRADSVAVARDAAANDPDPNVRAWASYALGASERGRHPLSPSSTNPD
jgi:beta-lactamase regulating signal transducer with metallopeptidase domain